MAIEFVALRFPIQKSSHLPSVPSLLSTPSPSSSCSASSCSSSSSSSLTECRVKARTRSRHSLLAMNLRCRPPGRRPVKNVTAASASEIPGDDEDDNEHEEEMEEALHMDGHIPDTSEAFVRQISSPAYHLRRRVNQSIDSSSYDVLDTNPWKDCSKPVYVLAQGENQLWTMPTRRMHREVEHELGLLFPRQGHSKSENSKKGNGDFNHFPVLVEDVREGILVFEDEKDAINYCSLLDRQHRQGCAGVAEIDASSVFDLCRKINALAVLLRRGRAHPLPDHLEQHLKSRKRSLEDQD